MNRMVLATILSFAIGLGTGLSIAETSQYRVWRWGKESLQQLKSCRELLPDWFPGKEQPQSGDRSP